MAWANWTQPAWDTSQPAGVPTIVPSAALTVSSAPVPPAIPSQYSNDQWAAMQQQNWQQWVQWQQQYQQWQQQYGEQYQKALAASTAPVPVGVVPTPIVPPVPAPLQPPMANAQPPLPPMATVRSVPPPPPENKPPPPPEDNSSFSSKSQFPASLNFSRPPPFTSNTSSNFKPVPDTAVINNVQPFPTNLNQPPPTLSVPRTFSRLPPDIERSEQALTHDSGSGTPTKLHQPLTSTTANQPPSLLSIKFEKPPAFEVNQSQVNKRKFSEESEWSQGNLNKTSRWSEQRGEIDKSFKQTSDESDLKSEISSNNDEGKPLNKKSADMSDVSEAEKKFDEQFKAWEEQFNKWKEQNANHPDKQQYKEYEAKWETWRNQLLERREQMRKKRLFAKSASLQSTSSLHSVETTDRPLLQNTTSAPPKLEPPKFDKAFVKEVENLDWDTQNKVSDSEEKENKSGTVLYDQPPKEQRRRDQRRNRDQINLSDTPEQEDLSKSSRIEFKPETNYSFIPNALSNAGIPGLDLVDVTKSEESKIDNKPDFEAISRGINNILGDEKLMNILSLVTQNKNSLPSKSTDNLNTIEQNNVDNSSQLLAQNNDSFRSDGDVNQKKYYENNRNDQYLDRPKQYNREQTTKKPPSLLDLPKIMPPDNYVLGLGNMSDGFRNNPQLSNNTSSTFNNQYCNNNTQKNWNEPSYSNNNNNNNNWSTPKFNDMYSSNLAPNERRPAFDRFDKNFSGDGKGSQNNFSSKPSDNSLNITCDNPINQGSKQFDNFPNQNSKQFDMTNNPRPFDNSVNLGSRSFDNSSSQCPRSYDNTLNQNNRPFDNSGSNARRSFDNFGNNCPRLFDNTGNNFKMFDNCGNNVSRPLNNNSRLCDNSGNNGSGNNLLNQAVKPFDNSTEQCSRQFDNSVNKNTRQEFGNNLNVGQKQFDNPINLNPNPFNNSSNQSSNFNRNMNSNELIDNRRNLDRFNTFSDAPNRQLNDTFRDRSAPPFDGNTNFREYQSHSYEHRHVNLSNNSIDDFNKDSQENQRKKPYGKSPWEDEYILSPATVVDYCHKPVRQQEPDDPFIEPVQTFDYGHMSKSEKSETKPRYIEKSSFALSENKFNNDKWNDNRSKNNSEDYRRNYNKDRRDIYSKDRRDSYNKDRKDNFNKDSKDDRDSHYTSRYSDKYSPKSDAYDKLYDKNRFSETEPCSSNRDQNTYSNTTELKTQSGTISSNVENSSNGQTSKLMNVSNQQNTCFWKDEFDGNFESPKPWKSKDDRGFLKNDESNVLNINESSKIMSSKSSVILIDDLLSMPGRASRPPRIVIILRGPPGSGKTFLAKLIKDKEVEHGGSAPRILSLDDYFMVEVESDGTDPETGRKIKSKQMVYEYEQCMENSYLASLIKAFKKTINDGYFSFIIVDCVNDKIKQYADMWSFAKQKGFQVYVCQMELDVSLCTKRNIHNRTEEQVSNLIKDWEPTPSHHLILDATSLIQSGSISEVIMDDVSDEEEPSIFNQNDSLDMDEENRCKSKWETMEPTNDKLARLDGTNKPLRTQSIKDYLQLDDEWKEPEQKPGQKRVRWADLVEKTKQEKLRAIGFIVGQTDWSRMMDPTQGSSALTQTKFFETSRK